MVRRYNPDIEEEWYRYDPEPTRKAFMAESQYGEWVALSTYLNETARLRKQIDRLKKIIKAKEIVK